MMLFLDVLLEIVYSSRVKLSEGLLMSWLV